MGTWDWAEWHADYDDPSSHLSRRLATVRHQIRVALDAAPVGPIRVVSLCAGDGRDIIGAVADHPRRPDVRGRLVELDPRLAARGRAGVAAAGVDLEVVEGDAARTDRYAGAVPAELVLVCGVFGNISDSDVEQTIAALPGFCLLYTSDAADE